MPSIRFSEVPGKCLCNETNSCDRYLAFSYDSLKKKKKTSKKSVKRLENHKKIVTVVQARHKQ